MVQRGIKWFNKGYKCLKKDRRVKRGLRGKKWIGRLKEN